MHYPRAASYELDESQKQLRGLLIGCLCTALFFVLARFFVRIKIQHEIAIDDILLLLAIVGFSILTGFLVHAIDAGGFGRMTEDLPASVFLRGVKYLVMSQTTYTLTFAVNHLSIAFLQLRITGWTSVGFNRAQYLSMAITVTIALYEFFSLLFQCYPIEKAWTPSMTYGVCADRKKVAIGAYVYSGFNVGLTWFYSLCLVVPICRLQTKWTVKASAIFVLGIGILASVATIIRLKYLVGFQDVANPLQAFTPIARWCWIELCLALSAASICTFRPLMQLLPWFKHEPTPVETIETTEQPQRPRIRELRGYTFQLSEIDSMNTNLGPMLKEHEGEESTIGGTTAEEDSESQKYIMPMTPTIVGEDEECRKHMSQISQLQRPAQQERKWSQVFDPEMGGCGVSEKKRMTMAW